MSDDRAATGGGMALDGWLELVARTLGAPAPSTEREERALLLDLARISSRRCERIAAPITTYVVGTALAAAEPAARVARLRRLVADLEVQA